MNVTATPQPPQIGRRFVNYLLGFGVSVAVGLAPYLGKLEIPLFEPLLNVLPPSEHGVAIPLSAAIMGALAVAVQWFAGDEPSRGSLRRKFVGTLFGFSLTVALFFVVDVFTVIRLPVAGDRTAVLLVGLGEPRCQECASLSPAECVRSISFEPSRIERCWGSTGLRVARLSLVGAYLAVTSLFGVLVGLLVVSGSEGRRTARRSAARRSPASGAGAPSGSGT